jgi:hypothetical protein
VSLVPFSCPAAAILNRASLINIERAGAVSRPAAEFISIILALFVPSDFQVKRGQ